MADINTAVGVDTSEAEIALNRLDTHAKLTANTVISTVRTAYQSIMLVADIMGQAIPVYYGMVIESVLMAASTMTTVATAFETMAVAAAAAPPGALTPIPYLLMAKAILGFGMAGMMFSMALALATQQSEEASKLNSFIQLTSLYAR
jgi:hypothetical protein